MYDIIESLIDHAWSTDYSNAQTIIFYICGTLIILFSTVLLDFLYRFITGIFKGGY